MRELADDLLGWIEEGRPFAVASVVGVSGSAPRGPGAALAVLAAALEAVRRGEPVAVARLVDGGAGVFAVFEDRVLGGHGVTDSLAEVVVAEARAMLDAGLTGLRTLGCGEEEAVVFVEAHTPPPRLPLAGTTGPIHPAGRAGPIRLSAHS
ncbi:XdhC family protein [Streptosporangium sp. NPDC003464]